MKWMKRNQSGIEPRVCQQKRSRTKKLIMFLTVLMTCLMEIAFVAQSTGQGVAPAGPRSSATQRSEEEQLELLHLIMQTSKSIESKDYDKYKDEFMKSFDHYFRNGCKKALQGKWIFRGYGDVVTIEYDDRTKSFFGFVTKIVKMRGIRLGHLLLKVYFPKVMQQDIPETVTVSWLREVQKCRTWFFTGSETSRDPTTQRDTVTDLRLTITGDVLTYQVANSPKPFYLDRLR